MNRKSLFILLPAEDSLSRHKKIVSYTKLKMEAEKLTSESFTTHHTNHAYLDTGLVICYIGI